MKEQKHKVNWKVVLGVALVVVLVMGYIKISELTNEISNLKGQIAYWQSEGNNICNEISSIYNNVDQRLKQEASLISNVTYEKEFRVSEKAMKTEKFKAGDKVAEEREGVLISLEIGKGKE